MACSMSCDIVNTTIALEQLDRYVSRSRRQSVFEAAQADLHRLYEVLDGRRHEDKIDHLDPLLDLAWEDAFAADKDDFLDPLLDDEVPLDSREVSEPVSAEERSAQVYRWGKRLSGVTWSPGGAISFVQYDNTPIFCAHNKRFMDPIWRETGWDGKASVTRHEALVRRDAMRAFGLPPRCSGQSR
jgi:hypothetical protein